MWNSVVKEDKMSWRRNLDNFLNFLLHICKCLLNTKVYVQFSSWGSLTANGTWNYLFCIMLLYFLSRNLLTVLWRQDIKNRYYFNPTRKGILRIIIHLKSSLKLCVKGN